MCVRSPVLPTSWVSLVLCAYAGVHSAACKEANEVASKLGATIILRGLAGLSVNRENVPYNADGTFYNTIVEAPPVQTAEPNLQVEHD